MRNTINPFLFLAVFFISCNNPSEKNKKKPGSATEADTATIAIGANKPVTDTNNHQPLPEVKKDSIPAGKTNNREVQSVKDWKTDDFIIKTRDKSNEALRRNIEYEREEWKDVPNPLIATYRGCDIGDYFHMNFEDAGGKSYDFGFGNNNYGDYSLFSKPGYNTNSKYLGKSFSIYWSWKVSSFPCCDGEYEMVEAYLPSITKLELTRNGGKK